jgi:hypothetical protein
VKEYVNKLLVNKVEVANVMKDIDKLIEQMIRERNP